MFGPRRFILHTRILKSAVLFLAGLMLFASQSSAQDDGQTVFKQKCAMCHGPNGEGKIGPALKGTKVGEDDIVLMLAKGKEGKKAPHNKPISGLTDTQIKTVAHYAKSLK
jgi:mono/diheme cytochrome c family protein